MKIDQVKQQLDKGHCYILYDVELQSTVIVSKDKLPHLLKAGEGIEPDLT